MNLRRTWTVFLLCSAVTLLAAAPGASAKPGYFVLPGDRAIELELQGSHGYRISIDKEAGGYVDVFVTKGHDAISYSIRSPQPKGGDLEARFPGIGRVSVRFRPKGPPVESSSQFYPGCRGGETVRQPGLFVGTIRLRGERGYTSVRANRVKGAIKTVAKQVCKRPRELPEPEMDQAELWAPSSPGRRGVGFYASRLGEPFDLTSFGVQVREYRGEMAIFRTASVTGEEDDLVIGDTRPYPLSATVTPPPPFSGSAEYERTPGGSRTWTGSLAVHLPGLGRVPLTGPRFSPRLCQLSGCHEPWIDGRSLAWTGRIAR